jgi:hypothetical protein
VSSGEPAHPDQALGEHGKFAYRYRCFANELDPNSLNRDDLSLNLGDVGFDTERYMPDQRDEFQRGVPFSSGRNERAFRETIGEQAPDGLKAETEASPTEASRADRDNRNRYDDPYGSGISRSQHARASALIAVTAWKGAPADEAGVLALAQKWATWILGDAAENSNTLQPSE